VAGGCRELVSRQVVSGQSLVDVIASKSRLTT